MLNNDLRVEKDRVYKLKDQLRVLEKNDKQKQEHMIKLEQKVRKLETKLAEKKGDAEDTEIMNNGYAQLKADEKIDELRRGLNAILKAREQDTKAFKLERKQFEKKFKEFETTIKQLEETIKEKDKEIKV